MEADRRAQEADRKTEEAVRRAEAGERRAQDEHRRAEEECQIAEEERRRADEADTRAEEQRQIAEQANRIAEEERRRADEVDTRAEEQRQIAEQANRIAEEERRRADEADARAEEQRHIAEQANRIAEEEHRRADEADTRAEEQRQKAEQANIIAEEECRRADESDTRAEEQRQIAEQANRIAEEECRRADEAVTRAEEQRQIAEQANRRAEEDRSRADEAVTRADQLKKANDEQWVVRREDIELTGPEIGRGGWATVSVAKFRGVQVAVKRIHNQIVSRHNEDLFRREMQMAARLRHPNLVQFIGATIRGDMMILMELMPTSLRRQIETDEYFTPKLVKQVSADIVKALNYLHQMKPDPMIHRDISSANILLEPLQPPKLWKAKITDYGSVNLVHQLHTENPGNPAYSAPEAGTPSQQTTKMDIYSFGVLMLEMLTGQLLAPENRSSLFHQVHHEHLLRLLQRCLSNRPADRPSAENIMSELL